MTETIGTDNIWDSQKSKKVTLQLKNISISLGKCVRQDTRARDHGRTTRDFSPFLRRLFGTGVSNQNHYIRARHDNSVRDNNNEVLKVI